MKSGMRILLAACFSIFALSISAQDGGGGNFPGDCDCDPNVFEPVCVADEEGNIFLFESACLAECFGLEVIEDGDCGIGGGDPGNGGGDPGNGGDPFGCDCDLNVFDPVCVSDEEGNVFPFENACLAECLGLVVVEGEDCDLGTIGDPFECDCEPSDELVCAIDENGITCILPGACFAECLGYELIPLEECDYGGNPGNGGGDPLGCDCDPNELEWVCVSDEQGNIFPFESACLAECLGLVVVEGEDCDFGGNPGDGGGDPFDCDCDPNELDWVCVSDEEGNIFPFESACFAECLGLTIVEGADCDYGDNPGDGGGDPGNGGGDPNGCDCEPNFENPVCVIDEQGNLLVFPDECLALCLGFEIVGEGECDFGGGDPGNGGGDPGNGGGDPGNGGGDPGNGGGDPNDCDCEPDFLSEVCVMDEEGNVFVFPDACLAECFGFEVLPDDECSFGGGDPDPNPCGCDWNEFDPVCVEDEFGNQFTYESACLAECDGLTVIGDGECDFGIEDPLGCDCDPEVFDPVCVVDPFGIVSFFPSACIAECLGLDIVDGDCEEPGNPLDPNDQPGFPGDNECDCTDEYDPVCVIVEGMMGIFPNPCIAECLGFEVVGDGSCFEDFPLEGIILNDPGMMNMPGLSTGDDDQIQTPGVEQLTIYPNPTNQNTNVSFQKNSEAIMTVELYNTAGQRVIAEKSISSTGLQNLILDTANLERGVYFLHLSSESGERIVEKVFKQ